MTFLDKVPSSIQMLTDVDLIYAWKH